MSKVDSSPHHVIQIEEDNSSIFTENSPSSSVIEMETVLETESKQHHGVCDTKKQKRILSYSENKNIAEGLMDIALLSANANQLRFLITYNSTASMYFISIGLVAVSLTLQVAVGIALIFKRRMKQSHSKKYTRTNEFLISGVFIITVVNILLAAFTTTDGK